METKERKSEQPSTEYIAISRSRRATLRRLGRFAAITPPAVTLLLSASTKRAQAIVSPAPSSSRQFKEPVSVLQLRMAA